MAYKLGLDLGSNSIGWALVDDKSQQILLSGVRVFPEGVDRDKQGGEVSKAQQRRTARGMRRQIARRARRKRRLMKILVEAGLLPGDPSELQAVFQLNPYSLRARGLDAPLRPFDLGRALMSLNQRRGFLSNRKSAAKKEEKGMLKEISDLQAKIDENRCRTLGEFLHRQYQSEGINVRLRGRHTRRSMIEHEFNLLWEAQKPHHPALLTDALREEIWNNTIAFQRKMYWPKYVVGRCDLEPRERRCRRAHRLAERFRLLQEVNNLRVIETTGELRPLAADERTKLIKYLSAAKERTFDDIRKHLGMIDSQGFNLEFGDRRKLLGLSTDVLLSGKKLFGKRWADMPEATKNDIVETILDDTIEEADFVRKAVEKWGLDEGLAKDVAQVDLPAGYASYSLAAIKKLLPYLENGLPLSGDDNDDALHRAGYLRSDERDMPTRDNLPAVPDIANPLVSAALAQVRQVVNAIIKEYGKPDAIHIELAREIKGNSLQRAEQSARMRERERTRDQAKKHLQEHLGKTPSRNDVDRYLMWQDQKERCIYSGNTISAAQLFNGEVDIDHVLPYSRSLDDSRLNKVLAFRSENSVKGNQTPYEWLAERQPEKYEQVMQRVDKLPLEIRNGIKPKFAVKQIELDDFIQRQLNDTKYISRKAAEYLKCLGTDVVCTKGQCTAELRHHWGLNGVLSGDGAPVKNRDDHRHHAVDAIVIAMTNRSRLQQLARTRGENYPPPWDGFLQAASESVRKINVSHRVVRKVSGQLHEETHYGPTAKPWRGGAESRRDVDGRVKERPWASGWIEQDGTFACRKELKDLTVAMIDDIRDPTVRKLVWDRLAQHGITQETKAGIPKAVWAEPLRMPGGRGPVIKKVRLTKEDQTIIPFRDGRVYVKTGSNHHVCIFEYDDGGKTKREALWVSRLDAAQRLRRGESVIQRTHPSRPEARFLMSLTPGEMVMGTFKGEERLCVFLTGASTSQQMLFAAHCDARKSAETKKFSAQPSTLEAKKVTVDPLGRIRWAND